MGGEPAAREALRGFWQAVSRAAMLSPIRRTPLDIWMGNWSLDYSPGYLALDFMSRAVSQSISFCDRRGARCPSPTLPNKAGRCWVWAIASLGVLCQALGCVASSRWELSGEEFSTETIWLL